MDRFDPPYAAKHWNNAGPSARARRPYFITDTGDMGEDSDESDIEEEAVSQILKDLMI